MSDSLSVLLIIGAAVVGPIEAQPIGGTFATVTGPGVNMVMLDTRIFESLSQLCERAMVGVGVTHPLIALANTDGYIGRAGDTQIRCIPTPTGYRK